MNDLLGLLGGTNPVMAIGRMVETVMQVTGDIVQSIGTFNDTLTEINKVARRVNALLDEIEGPVAEIVPLVHAGRSRRTTWPVGSVRRSSRRYVRDEANYELEM